MPLTSRSALQLDSALGLPRFAGNPVLSPSRVESAMECDGAGLEVGQSVLALSCSQGWRATKSAPRPYYGHLGKQPEKGMKRTLILSIRGRDSRDKWDPVGVARAGGNAGLKPKKLPHGPAAQFRSPSCGLFLTS